MMTGANAVSLVCDGLADGKCENAGCVMREVSGKRKCADKVSWQCAASKRVTDCNSFRTSSPFYIQSRFDQLCGKTLLRQRPTRMRLCKWGLRRAQQCLTHTDCPWPTEDELNVGENNRKVEAKANKTSIDEGHEIWFSKDGIRCDVGKLAGCKRYAKCRNFMRRIGCQAGSAVKCNDIGFTNLPAMAV